MVMWDDFKEQESGKGRKKGEWRKDPNFQLIFFFKIHMVKNLVYNTGQGYNSEIQYEYFFVHFILIYFAPKNRSHTVRLEYVTKLDSFI